MELTKKRSQKNQKKSKFRELTNKERVLITLLAIVILFWLSFKFIIDPQTAEIATLKTEIDDYTFEIQENNRMLRNQDLIIEERESLALEKENIEKDFFESLSQPEIIYILNELLLESNIEMKSISFTKPFVEILNEKEIEKMDISIPFKGDFASLNKIIKGIEEESRKIIINSIDVNKDDDTEIIGNINLGIYSLSGLVDVNKDDLLIEITDDNKSNPFTPYEGYVDPNKQIEEDMDESEGQEVNNDNPGDPDDVEEDELVDKEQYDFYKAVKGDNISYISQQRYGGESYVDRILKLNNMERSSILPIGKELKLIKK